MIDTHARSVTCFSIARGLFTVTDMEKLALGVPLDMRHVLLQSHCSLVRLSSVQTLT